MMLNWAGVAIADAAPHQAFASAFGGFACILNRHVTMAI